MDPNDKTIVMELKSVIKVIHRQATLQRKAAEIYEQEACEVLAFDSILDFYKTNYPDSVILKEYSKEADDEGWKIISKIFTDYVSGQTTLCIEDNILFLLEEFFQQFYLSRNSL